MINKFTYTALLAVLFLTKSFGQTNPTPQTLPYTQNFGTTSFATMPTGMAAWSGGQRTSQSAAEAALPGSDDALTAQTGTTSTGNIYGYVVSSNGRAYIQQSSNTTNGTNEIALSINTGTSTSIIVSYQVELLNLGSSTNSIGIELMYHLGNTASTTWTAVSGSNLVIAGGVAFTTQSYTYTISGLSTSTNYQLRWITWRPGSGTSCGAGIDNISVTTPVSAATATVSITGQDPNATPVNWALGSLGNIFYTSTVTPSAANATLNSVSANMSGSYVASDISSNGFKLYYSSDNTFVPAGDVLLGSQSSSTGNGETITWGSVSQIFTQSTAGYIYATADVSGSATAGNTLAGSFTSNGNVVFSPTVSYSGNSYGATIAKTFASLPTNPSIFNTNCASEVKVNINMNAPSVGTVLVFANTSGSFITPTGAGSTFTGASNNYSSATNYPAVGGNLIYSGAGNNFLVNGLTANTNYNFKAYSYSGSTWSSGTAVITGSATTQPVTTTVVTPASTQLQLSWANPSSTSCYNNVIVIARQGSAVESVISKANLDGVFDDANFTSANTIWTSNSSANDINALVGLGTSNTNFLVYKGTGNSVTLTGLTNGTPYFFRVFTVDGSGSAAKWSVAVDANGSPDAPGYYWNGGSISALPANGGTGTWGTTNAWRQPGASGSQATWANGNPAIFAGTSGVVTLDADRTASSYSFNTNSYTLQTTSTTARTLTGPLTIGNNNEFVIAPNGPSNTSGTIGFGSINGSGSASITLFGNQSTGNVARINLTTVNSTVTVPTSIITSTGTGGAGYVATATGAVIAGNMINNSALTTILGATSGFDISMNGTISGSAGLQISAGPSGGAGKVTLNNNNSYSGATYLNAASSGKVVLGISNALPVSTDLTMGYSSSNGGILDLNGFNQTIGNIANGAGGGSITNGSSILNSTLTVTQNTVGSFGLAITNGTAMTTAFAKNGSSILTLNGTGYTFSGGLNVNSGELRFNPSSAAYTLSSCPVVLNGGTLGTSGISANSVLNYSTLNVTNNSTISLSAANTHTLNFAASNALTWVPSKTIIITGWQGTYTTTTGFSGTAGKIVVGTSTTALTATQLSQIKFYDGSTYYSATLLSTGELVPYQGAPVTQLSSGFCGYTAASNTEFIWADSLGLPSSTTNDRYKFKLVNGTTTLIWTTNNQWPILQFYLVTGVVNNTTYTTSVAWSSDNGATFGAFGPICLLTSPGQPTTQLSAGSCGINPSTYNTLLFADAVGNATQYEYKLINSSLSYTQSFVKTNNNFVLSQFINLANSTAYSVTVRAYVNSVWGPFGSSCNVTTPSSLPTTSLSSSNCGIIASSYSQLLFADGITGATQYEYQLINTALSYTQSFVKTNNNFNLAQFTGLVNGTTYSVSVRINFGAGFGSYGPVCTITTPSSLPTTSLSASNCGIIASSYSQLLLADGVTGATQYEYQLINTSLSYTQSFVKTNNNFILAQFTGLTNGTTYSVSVRVNYNNTWGAYGTVCNVITPSNSPTTSLQASNCGYSAPTYTQIIFAVAVTGATQYEYQLTSSALSYTQSYVKTNNNFNLSQFTGLTQNTSYSVAVRVFFNNAWGPYGTACSVTTPNTTPPAIIQTINPAASQARNSIEYFGINSEVFDAMVYPNPYNEQFAVNLTSYTVNEVIGIRVFDATGKLIEAHDLMPSEVSELNLGSQYIQGIYNIVVSQAGKTKAVKVIKQ